LASVLTKPSPEELAAIDEALAQVERGEQRSGKLDELFGQSTAESQCWTA